MPGCDPDVATLADALSQLPDGPVAVAVSGGGDSMALMLLAAEWAGATGRTLQVVTVDHGLRAASAEEAAYVGREAAKLGLSHHILYWRDWDGQGNLQDQARRARYRLMADWAKDLGIVAVLLAHTEEDQAETLLMRLGRGAGVDGLSGMAPEKYEAGTRFLRPLLAAGRENLRDLLRDRGVGWIEDPSNQDPRFDRVKARRVLPDLTALGITTAQLRQVAANMTATRTALDWALQHFIAGQVTTPAGDLLIERAEFLKLPEELARRLIVKALHWINRADYAPRRQEVAQLLKAIRSGQGGTLQGCQLLVRKGKLHLFREYAAIAETICDPTEIWDRRWRLSGPVQPGQRLQALGEAGLAQCPDWRDKDRPAQAAKADPGIWLGAKLIAAPTLGFSQGWQACLLKSRDDSANGLFLH